MPARSNSLLLDKSQYAALRNDPTLNLYRFPGPHLVALRFNTTKGVFQDIRLRRAVGHAIDRKALIAGALFGLGRVASCMFRTITGATIPSSSRWPTIQLSKKLLAEAGYANGLTIKGYYSNASLFQTIAEAIKSMLGKVGITWQVDLLPPAMLVTRMQSLDYDLGAGRLDLDFRSRPDRDGLYHPYGAFNFGRSNNPEAIA